MNLDQILLNTPLNSPFDILPNPQKVSLQRCGNILVTNIKSHRRPSSWKDLQVASNGNGFDFVGTTFMLDNRSMAGNVPVQDDQIVDASGGVWSIKNEDLKLEGTIWHCVCILQKP